MAAVAVKEAASKGPTRLNAIFDVLKTFSRPARVDQHIRKAIEAGQLTQIIEGVQQPKRSTISMSSPGVLKHTIRGLRSYPQKADWNKTSVVKALARSRAVASLLEAEDRKAKKSMVYSESHKTPELLGTYLELAAVNAYKYQDGKDVDGKVKAAAGRLLSAFEHNTAWMQKTWKAPEAGQVDIVLESVPAWHGLSLAQQILGRVMPKQDLTKKILDNYGAGLQSVVEEVKAKDPQPGTYGEEAVRVWEKCIRA